MTVFDLTALLSGIDLDAQVSIRLECLDESNYQTYHEFGVCQEVRISLWDNKVSVCLFGLADT